MADLLTDDQLDEALHTTLTGWQVEDGLLVRSIQAADFLSGIRLVDAVAVAAEERDHHPDIDVRWTTVTFRLATHSEGGLTSKDVDLAAEIDRLASA
ncbi:MAG: 4a-hydroxytetrahydrobiopterin dehydratase [Nocardioidaceae bacterium]|jgi:4a-hydroxytetrahydrobiopterin dehydratase|nr:4a-hydroxytetrahydrobiopterin dehydratase [Nocardioidaceae bacterium]